MNRRRRHEWEIIKWWMVLIDWMKERKLFIRCLFIFSFPSFFLLKNNVLRSYQNDFFFSNSDTKDSSTFYDDHVVSPTWLPIRTNGGWKKKNERKYSAFYLFKKMSHVPHFFLFRWEKKEAKQTIGRFCRIHQPFIAVYLSLFPFFFCVRTFEKAAEHHQVVFFFLSFFFIFV